MVANGNRMGQHMAAQGSAAARDLTTQGAQWLQSAQKFVAERPVACLAGAFATGMVIAWFLKRTR